MRQDRFPPGWDEERVRKVLAHYEEQTEDEAVAEDEAAIEESTQTVMEVPHELVPAIRELIAKHHASRRRRGKDQARTQVCSRPLPAAADTERSASPYALKQWDEQNCL